MPICILLALPVAGPGGLRAAALPQDDLRIIYDLDRDLIGGWRNYSLGGQATAQIRYKDVGDTGPALIELRALADTAIGTNLRISGVKGRISFEYKITSTNVADSQFAVYAIPLLGKPVAGAPPVEVGSKQPGERSPSRRGLVLALPPAESRAAWRPGSLTFDFSDLPDAGHVIIALRVNEGTPAAGLGTIQFRAVRVEVPRSP